MAQYQYFANFKDSKGETFVYRLNHATNPMDADVIAESLAEAYGWTLISTFEDLV